MSFYGVFSFIWVIVLLLFHILTPKDCRGLLDIYRIIKEKPTLKMVSAFIVGIILWVCYILMIFLFLKNYQNAIIEGF